MNEDTKRHAMPITGVPILPPRRCPKNAAARQAWIDRILEVRSRLDFSPSARGWCYLWEDEGLGKGDFKKFETVLAAMRKAGELPLNITSEDDNRAFHCVEQLDYAEAVREAEWIQEQVRSMVNGWTPISFWDDRKVFLLMMVEKIDLFELFKPVCARYRVALANARGWSDVNSRAQLIRHCTPYIRARRRVVVLYCGDFDPGGLQIGNTLEENILELNGAYHDSQFGGDDFAVDISPGDIEVDRFGLNLDFINRHQLSWIDNLQTSSGKYLNKPSHADFAKPYVQNYVRDYCNGYLRSVSPKNAPAGKYYVTDTPRKVEANALVVQPSVARDLCEDAIVKYLGTVDVVEEYETALAQVRPELSDIVDGWFD